jgi:AAA domain
LALTIPVVIVRLFVFIFLFYKIDSLHKVHSSKINHQKIFAKNGTYKYQSNYYYSALGTQADIVLFSLARNNPESNEGAAGTLQDLNVGISKSKEKLIILGNFDMMLNG